MKILLVTFSDMLPTLLNKVLSPELEFCAVVVDDVESAKRILPQQNVFPLYDLKECVQNFNYDFILCITDTYENFLPLSKQFLQFGLPVNKLVSHILNDEIDYSSENMRPYLFDSFLLERAMRYYKKHSAEFEMLATGMSYTAYGLDADKFQHKLFNFGRSSGDIYYDYQVVKFATNIQWGGG